MQLLLAAHPVGLVVGDIQEELNIPSSTLSHHLEKLKSEELVQVRRESTFLRYTANTEALQELLRFLYLECCTRNKALKREEISRSCRKRRQSEYREHQSNGQGKIRPSSASREGRREC